MGYIHLIIGPMGAGKTSKLINLIHKFERMDKKCVLLKNADYNTDEGLISHVKTICNIPTIFVNSNCDKEIIINKPENIIDLSFRGITNHIENTLEELSEIRNELDCGIECRDCSVCANSLIDKLLKYDVIAIDEAQFFNSLDKFVENLANMDKIVIVVGLDANYKAEGFKTILDIIPKAEYISKLSSICTSCKNFAYFTNKKCNFDKIIEVGAFDLYSPSCRKCYYHNIQNNQKF